MKIFITILFLALLSVPIVAQDQTGVEYTWETGGLTLTYPAGWDEPLPGDDEITLQLAQTLVDAPEMRPAGIPMLTLRLIPSVLTDPEALLTEELRVLGIETLESPAASTILGVDAITLTGTSADGSLFGIGRAAAISDAEVLIIVGRALTVQRESFTPLFDTFIDNLISDGEVTSSEPSYGVVWHTIRTQADGEEGFLNLIGLAYSGGTNHLYSYERDLGVVEIDATTGEINNLIAGSPDITDPADIAVTPDGLIFVTDRACECVFSYDGSEWLPVEVTDFSEGAPENIIASNTQNYTTNREADSTIAVWMFTTDGNQQPISLDTSLFEQPLLAMDATGRILALTQYGQVLSLEGAAAAALFDLGPLPESITDFTVNTNGNVVLTTADSGVIVLNAQGEEIERLGRIVPNFPLAGEFVSPVAVTIAPDGTLYIADSDGTFGAVTAMSTAVAPGRIGGTTLALGLGVQGTLSESTPQQTWTYEGTAGQRVTLSAFDASQQDALNVAVRLLAPDGSEVAFNDDQEGDDLFGLLDAQIADYPLAATGTYIVVVERVDGEGVYQLGISETKTFTLGAEGVTSLEGEISDIFPTQRWQFEGQAGQTFTITMQPTTGTLDPALRLIAPNGEIIAENDDAGDPALGTSAQIFGAQLPANGSYTIEARRFEGTGRYELVIVAIA